MSEDKRNPIIIFYSWQSDSERETNHQFLQNCLDEAARIISEEDSVQIVIDSDTRGVGGSPCVVDTIMKKIKKSDIFLWDATLVFENPRPAPNINVVLEFGYALAVLGDLRVISIMNTGNGCGPELLPFDFNKGTRRWPLQYSFKVADVKNATKKSRKMKVVTQRLIAAIRNTLTEPKAGALQNDVDFYIARKLWKTIDSKWIANWSSWRFMSIQFDRKFFRNLLDDYVFESKKPENTYCDDTLLTLHDGFLNAVEESLNVGANEMMPQDNNPDMFVINAKYSKGREGWYEDHDRQYKNEITKLKLSVEKVVTAWEAYVSDLRQKYPEVTHG
jgi:hypothetical protein